MDDEFRITKQAVEQQVERVQSRILSGHHRIRAYQKMAMKTGCPVYMGVDMSEGKDRTENIIGVVLSTEERENGEVIADILLYPPPKPAEHVTFFHMVDYDKDLPNQPNQSLKIEGSDFTETGMVDLSGDTGAEEEDPYAGMVQNPITGEWRWL